MQGHGYLTAAFYLFVELPDCAALQAPLLARCEALEIKGLILLAHEGINGTVAGAPENIAALLGFLRADPRLRNLEHKESWSEKPPFRRMRVRVKREIVTLGVPGINPAKQAGIYVKPQHWNALISRPDVIVVDTRNTYEVELGTFQRAKNPQIASFSELPRWIESAPSMQPERGKRPVVAMFCTGGIRCEKSTALLRQQGFTEVYHLQGQPRAHRVGAAAEGVEDGRGQGHHGQIVLLRNFCARTFARSHCPCRSRAPSFCAGLVLA